MQLIYPIIITLIILIGILYVIPMVFRKLENFFAPVDRAYYHYADYPRLHRADLDYDYMTHTNFPFWNTQLGNKRNMSYDLRGDVWYPNLMWTPFNMTSTVPIRNKPLYLVS